MINFANVILEKTAIHKIGNKSTGEKNFLSEVLYMPSGTIEEKLLKYFFQPFKKKAETYHFHRPQQDNHRMQNNCRGFFNTKENFLSISQDIATHLFNQSKHSNIKKGELFVVHFSELLYGDEMVEAIGIFKCERKNEFMQVNKVDSELLVNLQEGIHLEKMDKAALILNTEQEDGYRILSVDNNYYDTQYWLHDFLDVTYVKDEWYNTETYLMMINDFANKELTNQMSLNEKIDFLNDSVDYMATHEVFKFEDFANEVAPSPEVVEGMRDYQRNYELLGADGFHINYEAINKNRKLIKKVIKLDNGVKMNITFDDHQEGKELLERGFDEDKGMYFYRIFFNEEFQ